MGARKKANKQEKVLTEREKIFKEIKDKYREFREEEKKLLIESLEKEGYTFPKDVRYYKTWHGNVDYKNYGTIEEYNLTNHMYMEVEKNGTIILITFQPMDRDVVSGNRHSLYDRIGFVYWKNDNEKNDAKEKPKMITSIDLPLDEDKLLKLNEELKYFISKLDTLLALAKSGETVRLIGEDSIWFENLKKSENPWKIVIFDEKDTSKDVNKKISKFINESNDKRMLFDLQRNSNWSKEEIIMQLKGLKCSPKITKIKFVIKDIEIPQLKVAKVRKSLKWNFIPE
jgi:hypothetical protein